MRSDSATRAAVAPARSTHACGRYRDVDDLVERASAFLAAGLERGERCVFVGCTDVAEIAERVAARIGAADLEVIDASAVYSHPSAHADDADRVTATIAGIIEVWERLIAESFAMGKRGLCVAADVDALARDDALRQPFLVYESVVGRFISGTAMSALCLYHDSLPASEFADFACVHEDGAADATQFRLFFAQPDVLSVSGEIDVSSHDQFARALERLVTTPAAALVLDASGLEFIDHRGVLALDAWAGRHECELQLRHHRSVVDRLVEAVGCSRLLARRAVSQAPATSGERHDA